MNLFLLGVFGPWQLLVLLFIGCLVVLPIVLLTRNARHKSRAELLDQQLREAQAQHRKVPEGERYDRLERLNELRKSGVLSEEEFEREKRRVLG